MTLLFLTRIRTRPSGITVNVMRSPAFMRRRSRICLGMVVCPLLVRVASVFMTIGLSPYQVYYSKETFIVQPRMSARRGDGIARLVYQFTARAVPTLLRTFGDVRRSFERRNFPPAQLFLCTTHGASRPVCRYAGVPAERSYRAPLMERDRDRKYASDPPSISVALFRHT